MKNIVTAVCISIYEKENRKAERNEGVDGEFVTLSVVIYSGSCTKMHILRLSYSYFNKGVILESGCGFVESY